jgi:hypothetical protein
MPEARGPEMRISGGAAAPVMPAPRVDWPTDGAAPVLGPARPLAAE